jgi:hypothetical protein
MLRNRENLLRDKALFKLGNFKLEAAAEGRVNMITANW